MTRLLAVCLILLGAASPPAVADEAFALPPGFSAEVLVEGVDNARAMVLSDAGTLFVSTRRVGRVYAVRGALSGQPEVLTVAENMTMPNGIAFRDGDLYVADVSRIVRWSGIESRLEEPGQPDIIDADLPVKGKLHAWKYMAFGPDDKLYVALGAPCNVCDEPDLTVILRMNPDGSEREVFARGIRNSVGFTWHPGTGEMWFTDNGRDMMGDDVPPCELNRVPGPGRHFGFPFCHGSDVVDPEFGQLGDCADIEIPAQNLAPHSAPLGLAFYTGEMFPSVYRGDVLIAEHGSWNRSKAAGRTGYRISRVRLEGNRAIGYEPFMTGFLSDDGSEVLGRPVDVLVAPDGSLLVSDDKRGVIYRVTYHSDGASL